MFDYQTGGDASSGGGFLSVAGTYHVAVMSVDTQPTTKDGRLIDNAACKLKLSVLAGTAPGQEGKTFFLTIFLPKLDAKDGGKMGQKIIDRFLMATGLITREDIEAKKKGQVDLEAILGRSLFVKMGVNKDGYVELSYSDLWHIDDPDAADFPRNQKTIDSTPKTFPIRWSANGKAKVPPREPATPLMGGNVDGLNL